MKSLSKVVIGSVILGAILVQSCTKNLEPEPNTVKSYDGSTVTKWIDAYTIANQNTTGYRPPVAARVLAYTGLAAYEAAAPGMVDYQSVGSSFPEIKFPKSEPGKTYHWAESVNAAYWKTFKKMFPFTSREVSRFDSLYTALNEQYALECDSATFARSKKFGLDVAQAINDYSVNDGGEDGYRNNKPASYIPPVGEGLWRYTAPDFRRALLPYWGKVKPLTLKPEDKLGIAPIKYSTDKSSDFYKQALEVYQKSKNVTAEQRWIAEFWSDDEPPNTFDPATRMIVLANQVLKLKKTDLEIATLTWAKLGIALFDASIAVWNTKFTYNVLRPQTYIQEQIDANWVTNMPKVPVYPYAGYTPPFPAYPSGHSSFGGATGDILDGIFGTMTFTDKCHEGRTDFNGTPRTFSSFKAAGEENAESRIYLGVHFRMDCTEGLRIGRLAAQRVNELKWKK
jgi:hypothetical protein